MGAGASAMQALPDAVPKKQAQALAAATPGLHWDDNIWAEIAQDDGTALKVDIVGLLDQLNLRVRMAEEQGEELLAVDGSMDSEGPGAFSPDEDEDDLPAMVFADGTGGLVVGAHNAAPARRKRAPKPRCDVEETFASEGQASRPRRRAPSTRTPSSLGGLPTPRAGPIYRSSARSVARPKFVSEVLGRVGKRARLDDVGAGQARSLMIGPGGPWTR